RDRPCRARRTARPGRCGAEAGRLARRRPGQVPPRILRRPAAAAHERARADHAAQTDRRRRAGQCARRLGAGAGAQSAGRPAGRVRLELCSDQPRSGRGVVSLRRDRRDLSRAHRRAGDPGRPAEPLCASLYPRVARSRAARPPEPPAAAGHAGDRVAICGGNRLRLRREMPLCRRALHRGSTRRATRRTGPFRRMPPCRDDHGAVSPCGRSVIVWAKVLVRRTIRSVPFRSVCMSRKLALLAVTAIAALSLLPQPVAAQAKKDSVVMAMALEPPGLDPTSGAAAAIAEVTLYNVYETLTKVKEDGTAAPLLAESWTTSPDVKTYTFKLRKGVKFQNGEPLNADTVKFSFERSAAPASTNKDKSLFQSIAEIATPDADTVVIKMKNPEPNLPFLLGQAPASIVEPKSVDTNGTKPVGTGPFTVAAWAKGSSITLAKWPEYRDAAAIKLNKVTIRFISDPSAQVASLLSGDVVASPRVAAARSLAQFKADPRFAVLIGGSRAKTIVTINNKHKPFDDVRFRRAVLAAIDRKAMIEGAADGFGVPIGSFYVPGALGYVDTTDINPFDPEKAKKLLAEAGVKTPLEISLKLPPPAYARQGGEVLAAQLAKVGITAKIENLE